MAAFADHFTPGSWSPNEATVAYSVLCMFILAMCQVRLSMYMQICVITSGLATCCQVGP